MLLPTEEERIREPSASMRSAKAGGTTFRVASTGKSGKAHHVSVVDELRRLLRGHHLGFETSMGNTIFSISPYAAIGGSISNTETAPTLSTKRLASFIQKPESAPPF